jgi:transcriptional regulator with XRE-family HTH domain
MPFGRVIRDLLIARGITTKLGNPLWTDLAAKMPNVSYESLRKAAAGERLPSRKVMEECARVLKVDPVETFAEYRLWSARRELDPAEVGLEIALETLLRREDLVDRCGL